MAHATVSIRDGSHPSAWSRTRYPELLRFGLADHKSQTIARLKDLPLAGFLQLHGAEKQVGVAPDGSPVLTRDIGSQEIYALSVKWP
jgi:hypothetical protein